jgi:hypothetical protein
MRLAFYLESQLLVIIYAYNYQITKLLLVLLIYFTTV